jgi:hypothetical protein
VNCIHPCSLPTVVNGGVAAIHGVAHVDDACIHAWKRAANCEKQQWHPLDSPVARCECDQQVYI